MGAFLFVGVPFLFVGTDEDEGHLGAFELERKGAADGYFAGAADEDFALDAEWREEFVFHRDPAAADDHAAGDETEHLGKFAAGDVFGLDPFDGKIDFVGGFGWKGIFFAHGLVDDQLGAAFGHHDVDLGLYRSIT